MKLTKSQKKNAEKKQQVQELYPKVKTFSKAYDFAPKKEESPVAPSADMNFFALDERPYPTAVSPVSYPVIPNKSADFNDPERIDLQDTLLTDESFTGRHLEQPGAVSVDSASETPAGQDDTEKESLAEEEELRPRETREEETLPEETALPEEESFWETDNPDEAGTVISEESNENDAESLFGSEPEAEYEAGSYFEHDSETDSDGKTPSETDLSSESDPVPDNNPGLTDKYDEETLEPFSWFDPDDDFLPEESAGIAFKKQEYTARVGKKKNLRKKLRTKPAGSLKWKSSNKKIAKVSQKGILKPKKKGKVTVRVKAKGGDRAKVKILIVSSKKKKKQKTMPWESVGTDKKAAPEKKWVRLA